jgi:hypothetical protein
MIDDVADAGPPQACRQVTLTWRRGTPPVRLPLEGCQGMRREASPHRPATARLPVAAGALICGPALLEMASPGEESH